MKKLIYNFKYDFVLDVKFILERIINDFVKYHQICRYLKSPSDVVVCPVPLHPDRLLWRGFNQSSLLAENLAISLGASYQEDLLTRTRATAPQMLLDDVNDRKLNVYEAFTANNASDVRGKTVIILDDVTTTGATLNECAKALKKFKPQNIYGFVLAQG